MSIFFLVLLAFDNCSHDGLWFYLEDSVSQKGYILKFKIINHIIKKKIICISFFSNFILIHFQDKFPIICKCKLLENLFASTYLPEPFSRTF